MAMPANATLPLVRSEPRTRTALRLESIALRHQIAVRERSGTRRPCFGGWDRLFWILLSRQWDHQRDSLSIVQPETVLRWRREGWSTLWRYRARGRWRGGRPRVSSAVRHLVGRMARENFLWGAPRIHGELLMLGFSVSQATVSRYLPARSRRPGQSWRTFLRNQATAFGQYSEERSRLDAGLHGQSHWAQFQQSAAAQMAALWVGFRRGLAQAQANQSHVRISLRLAQCDCGVTHRAASVSGGSRRALNNGNRATFQIRSPPQARTSPRPQRPRTNVHAPGQVSRRHTCSAGGNRSRVIACNAGISAPPAMPWSTR